MNNILNVLFQTTNYTSISQQQQQLEHQLLQQQVDHQQQQLKQHHHRDTKDMLHSVTRKLTTRQQ